MAWLTQALQPLDQGHGNWFWLCGCQGGHNYSWMQIARVQQTHGRALWVRLCAVTLAAQLTCMSAVQAREGRPLRQRSTAAGAVAPRSASLERSAAKRAASLGNGVHAEAPEAPVRPALAAPTENGSHVRC